MKPTRQFFEKFAASIVSILGRFDRVIFKGHLPFGGEAYLNSFVDNVLEIRRKDFLPWLEQHSQTWLAQQMIQWGLSFVQNDIAFLQLDDSDRAQTLADKFAKLPWVKQLRTWARKINPLLSRRGWLSGMNYYWVTEQAEHATDVLFAGKPKLRELYPRLLDHAAVNFSARDVLGFLGRKLHGDFQWEVITDLKKKRSPGARIKHQVKENWLKMYDKFGLILRVETVINNPREFRVRRKRERKGEKTMVWCPMNKGVINLPSYEAVARASNNRYFDALSAVHDPTRSYQQVARLANRTTRLFKRLHVRGLIARIPRTRRWRVTALGHRLLGTIVQLHYHGLANAA